MRRDKAGVECYAMPPRFAKKYEAMKDCHVNAAQVYGRKCPASERKIATTGTYDT
jgi:hypothetical protein